MTSKYLTQNIASCLPIVSAVYRKGENLDVVVKRGSSVSEIIEGVSPSDFHIHKKGSFEIDSPWYLDVASCKKNGKISLNAARNLGFPANYLPVTISGKTYYLDAGYKSKSSLDALSVSH